MTYSIVARDPDTGDMGVAVQSHYFSVGSVVTWAEAGVGAVATQATADISYGPIGLERMRNGQAAEDALRGLVAADPGEAHRQVAMVDARGNAFAHTGARCIVHAVHRTAPGVSVQANMMERDTVPDAMLAAYHSAQGDLTDRLLAALDAAEAEGGDIRGRQSAAILVVAGAREKKPGTGRLLELRVEDNPEPLAELRRLVNLGRAYRLADEAEKAATAADMASATSKMMQAMDLAPGNAEITFWAAIGLALAGQIDAAKGLLSQATKSDPRWAELVRRLPATGVFPLSDETIAKLTGE